VPDGQIPEEAGTADGIAARAPSAPRPDGALAGRRVEGRTLLTAAAVAVLLAALYAGLGAYWLVVFAQVFLFAVAAMGLDILFGRTGQLSLSHASFYGLGAYVAAIGTARGVWPGAQFVAVFVVALVAGVVVAVPTLRLAGLRLALVTLLFGEVFQWFLITEVPITGGSEGMSVPPLSVAGLSLGDPHTAFLVCLALALLATAVTRQLGRTQAGRRMLAVRDSELAASACGIDLARIKIQAFIIASVYAAVAGWFYAFVVGFVAPDNFGLFPAAYFLVAVILGGAGTVMGAWLGAAYIVLAPQFFNVIGHPNLFPILGGALLVLVALFMPDGLVGGISRTPFAGIRVRLAPTSGGHHAP